MLISLLSANAFAQGVGGKNVDPNYLVNLMGQIVLVCGGAIIILVLIYLLRFSFQLLQLQKERLYREMGLELPVVPVKPPLWERLYQQATKLVPISEEADLMMDHDYDGIRELDNSLPPWWVAMFYITIIIGTAYFAYYHYYDYGLSSTEAYVLEMEHAERAKALYVERQANLVNESNVVALLDEASLSAGRSVFLNNCAACHGQLGEGGVGPNLTDAYWLHGADIKSVFKVVKHGVPEKGMIAWKTQLRPAAIHEVASYILTLKGTNPPNGKAPQGNLVSEEDGEQPQNTSGVVDQKGTTIGMR
ncbi:MAG: cbb3-type cytochrome c oxidase N-terminal domain-containing protein [Bacteroidota bacterium]